MVAKSPDEQLKIIRQGTVEIISEEELVSKLAQKRPLVIKAGFDPTAPDIHLGHTVLLHKLRQFQELGHKIKLLIGDFTAMIGDPTGKSETRPPLTREDVLKNSDTYKKQVFKILDEKETDVVFNSEWLGQQTSMEMIDLASRYTVARMLERDDFSKRYKEGRPIAIHEFLYPLLQGHDSVALKADVELGGTDQKFNLLVGRNLQRDNRPPLPAQVVITMPLLEGTDGVNKMSKSLGNYIGITEPAKEIVGKVMSISDELMMKYWELVGEINSEELQKLKSDLSSGAEHPRDLKMRLARKIAARFHGEDAGTEAEESFDAQFRNKDVPTEMENVLHAWTAETERLVNILATAGAVKSAGEARRLIKQGGLAVNGEKIEDTEISYPKGEYTVRLGKKKYLKISPK
ncbi:MAG: tyrosine--tRNA ligase [Nitrospinae bacterium]|nr:tyrosine--tRNA ligase [Nitrospinota bacterium]